MLTQTIPNKKGKVIKQGHEYDKLRDHQYKVYKIKPRVLLKSWIYNGEMNLYNIE